MFVKSFIFLILGTWIWLTMGPGKRTRWVQRAQAPVRPGRLGTKRLPGGDKW
jgi:hypothetical protein